MTRLLKYAFVPNDVNLNTLGQLGFEIRPLDIQHYYWNYYDVDMYGQAVTQTLLIDRETNALSYVRNTHTKYDLIDVRKLDHVVANKVKQLVDNKLITVVQNQRDTTKKGYMRK